MKEVLQAGAMCLDQVRGGTQLVTMVLQGAVATFPPSEVDIL
jgi:hypothetical protein